VKQNKDKSKKVNHLYMTQPMVVKQYIYRYTDEQVSHEHW